MLPCLGQDHFQQEWGQEGVVDLHAELSKLIIKTASRTLLGTGPSPERAPTSISWQDQQPVSEGQAGVCSDLLRLWPPIMRLP